jgi:hypothetical protein
MGACCSDDVATNIKPDPSSQETILCYVAQLGIFGSRDYGIWQNTYPSSSSERTANMWMWFNKSTSEANPAFGVIDLENFVRGHKENDPKKGRVLYSAIITEKPIFQMFQKQVDDGAFHNFMGIFTGNYNDPEDLVYVRHPNHTGKKNFGHGGERVRDLEPDILTKWSFATRAYFKDGDLGRGAASFGNDQVVLEIFSKGAVVTSYQEIERQVEDQDSDGNVVGHHMERRIDKNETEFVDRIEFRLSFRGMIWATWAVQGDTYIYGDADATIDCPLFTTTIEGGWITRSRFRTQTKPGVDPALALLIAHVCGTEYSVQAIKQDLSVNISLCLPGVWIFTPYNPSMNYQSPIQIQENVTFSMTF